MAYEDQAPQEFPETHPDHGMRYEHPAFGQIQVSHIQGNRTLYGSDFRHHAYIAVRIAHSQLYRSLSRDWHHTRDEIVEVNLSEAQWATFVSSMNVGQGVPCTLNHLHGKGVPGIPHRTEDHHFKNEVRETIGKALTELDAAIAEVKNATMPAKRRQEITSKLEYAAMHLRSNLPFVADSFDEHVEKKTEQAKMEANAYITHAVMSAGLDALGVPLLTDDRNAAE